MIFYVFWEKNKHLKNCFIIIIAQNTCPPLYPGAAASSKPPKTHTHTHKWIDRTHMQTITHNFTQTNSVLRLWYGCSRAVSITSQLWTWTYRLFAGNSALPDHQVQRPIDVLDRSSNEALCFRIRLVGGAQHSTVRVRVREMKNTTQKVVKQKGSRWQFGGAREGLEPGITYEGMILAPSLAFFAETGNRDAGHFWMFSMEESLEELDMGGAFFEIRVSKKLGGTERTQTWRVFVRWMNELNWDEWCEQNENEREREEMKNECEQWRFSAFRAFILNCGSPAVILTILQPQNKQMMEHEWFSFFTRKK